MMKRKLMFGIALIFLIAIAGISAAQQPATVCCEKTKSGLYCQDVPAEQCDAGFRQVSTSCRATSYCKPGTCYDSNEGTCLDNTPQIVCNNNKGLWTDKPAPQCELGCCVLGDQAAFVSLVRCKRLSSVLGLQTNYKKGVTSEVQCIASVTGQEKGACVYTYEFQKTCKITTKDDCVGTASAGAINKTAKGEFFAGKLCSAEELGTICGPTSKTVCVPGKEEVYFVDSCGNPANIYDASKINDKNYWTDIKDKSASCNANAANANNPSCGNCNYILGSFCRKTTTGARATYGDNICADLICHNTANGKTYKHGESWCVNDDKGTRDKGDNSVGSRYYKHICINGEEVLEACADFRQHECIESKIGDFSQAACRVNRWQDCTAQTSQTDCENSDKRDCLWKGISKGSGIACVPKNSPGLNFWEGDEASGICAKANAQCEVTFEKRLWEGGGGKCTDNCECLGSEWANAQIATCKALGDCGPKINWLGDKGNKPSYAISKS